MQNSESTPISWNTQTVADLLFKQNKLEQAAQIYRELIAQNPGNTHCQTRLEAIEQKLPTPPTSRSLKKRTKNSPLLNFPNCLGAALVGADGIVVLQSTLQESEELLFEELVAEFILLAKRALNIGATLTPAQEMQHFSLQFDDFSIVLRPITSHYFIIAVLKKDAYWGQVKYAIDKIIPKLTDSMG